MTPLKAISRIALFLLLAAPAALHAITLEKPHLQAAQAELYPAFVQVHDMLIDDAEAVRALMEQPLAALAQAMEGSPALDVLLVNNPDADAGCLAGGRLFLSLGVLAHIQDMNELAAALALAASLCPAASADWRERDAAGLPPLDDANPLIARYEEYRLPSLAPLYRQLIAIDCGACMSDAVALLQSQNIGTAPAKRLLTRVQAWHPQAALILRFGDAGADSLSHEPESRRGDEDTDKTVPAATDLPRPLHAPLGTSEDALAVLADLRLTVDSMAANELIDAYNATMRARLASGHYWLALLWQSRIEARNQHPEYAQRELESVLEHRPDLPWKELLQGMVLVHQYRLDAAIEHLERSLEQVPTVTGHYYLGVALQVNRQPEKALEQMRQVMASSAAHRYFEDASARVAALEAELRERGAD